jgi:hypothetical protein
VLVTDRAKRHAKIPRGLAWIPMPELGDSAKLYPYQLTEPQINSIHAAVAFIEHFCKASHWPFALRFWAHYGPTLKALSESLAKFDD